MAAARPVQGLQEEATCSICLEYYRDPVITKCGHNFCRSCITGCSEGSGTALPCPQCRELCPQGDLRANRQLQSMVDFVKQLSVQQERPPEEGLCEEHEERLKLFCEEDEKLICVICQVSSLHKLHSVSPIKEAAEKYKFELQDILKPLRVQMGAAQQCKLKEEEVSRALRKKLEAERRKIETEFEKLRQTLKEQEQTLLRRLEEMDKKIITVERLKMAKLSAEIACLKELITEIEEKCGQPAGELLQDVRSTLSRSRRQLRSHVTEEPVQDSPKTASIQRDPQHRSNEDVRLSQCKHEMTDPTPGEIKQRYKDPVCGPPLKASSHLCRFRGKPSDASQRAEAGKPCQCLPELLRLDDDTAHGRLTLSEEGRRVTAIRTDRCRPSNPRRFTGSPCVLGKEGFTSGRHYWELQLLREGGWAVGVAQESVSRLGLFFQSPEGGVWAVDGDNGQYRARTSPHTPLSPSQRPLNLGVYLDYEAGRLSVYNADTLEELFTFTGANFTGRVCPYFYLYWGQICALCRGRADSQDL